MAFQMSNIKCETQKHTIQNKIKRCFGTIKGNDLITDNVKYALCKYVDYRFTKRNSGNLDGVYLQQMIEELLEFVINKKYTSISLQDVINNESEILYEIKKAIIYGATRKLYFDMSEHIQNQYKGVLNTPVIKLTKTQLQEKQSVVDYFKDLLIV